jgi:Mrp family chromosome partitioning ATPase
MSDRYVVLGLAQVRSAWFRDVSRWSTSAAVPIDFVKCMSVDEVRAHLASGRAFSALVLDAGLPGLDRDLVGLARDLGSAVILVEHGTVVRDIESLGVAAVLPHNFDRSDLLRILAEHAMPVGAALNAPTDRWKTETRPPSQSRRARVVAVTGAGGTGTSVIAMALARALAEQGRATEAVLLADLALDADQAMLHDARDIVPSVQELTDAFRHGGLDPQQLWSMTFGDGHPYRVLLGLRRHRDWTALRARSWYAALDELRCAFTLLVADIDADFEGEAQCGSLDVEERNLLARSIATVADVVVVTGLPGVQGLHRLVRVIDAALAHGVPAERLLPVINRAPRSPRARAELSRALAELTRPALGAQHGQLPGPVFIGEQRRFDVALRDGLGPATAMRSVIGGAVHAALTRAHEPTITLTDEIPVPVSPGSLGSWADGELEGDG